MDDYYESIYDWYKFEIMEQLVDYRTGEDIGQGTWWKKEETKESEANNEVSTENND
jgi:hypothetical protein